MRSKQHRGLVHILLIEVDDKIAAEIQPVLRSCAGKITSVSAGCVPEGPRESAPAYSLVVCAGFSPEVRRELESIQTSSGVAGGLILVLPPGLEAEAAPLVEALPCEVVVHDGGGKFLHLLRPLVRRALQEEAGALWEARGEVEIMDQVRLLTHDRAALISRYRPDTTLTYVNDVYCSFFQLSPEALLGRSFLDFIPPEVGELVRSNLAHLRPEYPVHTAEYFVPMTELGPRWYEWTDIAVFDASGAMIEIHGVGRDITLSKRAEQRYRKLFDGLGEAALVADPATGRIQDVNAHAEILLKRGRSELVGAPYSILWPPEKVTLGEALFRHHVREGGNLESKLEVMRGDGKVIPMVWRSTMIDHGSGPQLLSVFHDVSSQAVVEQALRESEERFREFVEGTDNLVVQIDPQGRLLYLNRAGERLFRSSSSACRGLRILDFMHPEDRAQTAAHFDAWIRSKVSGGTIEGRMLGPGGAVRHILWTASLHYDEQTNLAYINAIGRDVTEWKRAEQELRASEHAMRRLYEITAARSRDGARTVQYLLAFGTVQFGLESGLVLENASGVAEVRNSENLPAEWNARALEELYGQLPVDPGEGRLDPVDFEVTDGTEDSGEGFQRLGVQAFLGTRLFIQDRPYGMLAFFSREPRRRPFSGGERELLKLMAQWVETVIEMGFASVRQERLQTRVQQAQKLESLGIMAGGVAHDFNNLLLSILGNADLLRQDASVGSTVAETASQIVLAARRAAELTSHMLAYTGKGRTYRETLDFNEVVGEIAGLLRAALPRETVLELRLAEGLPGVNGDATQLRQVVMNLIKNASEAVSGKAVHITVETGTEHCTSEYLGGTYLLDPLATGKYVYVQVRDTGCGMTPEVMKRIFDPFFTTKFTGRGLGLAAVIGIVRGHHGAVEVDSTPGAGTRFKVLFPAAGVAPHVRPVEERREWKPGTGVILVVEDEAPVRRLTSRVLSRAGYTVILAATGEEAIEQFRLRRQEIDLVLLDLMMAPMSGEDVCEALMAERADVRVLFTSGYSREDVEKRLNRKDFEFIHKPYEPAELTQRVEQVISSRVPA